MTAANARSRGSALIIAIIVVVIVGGLAAAFLTVSLFQGRTARQSAQAEKALAAAEAGIDATLFRMNHWSDGTPTMSSTSGVVSGGAYVVSILPAYSGDPSTYMLRSTGSVESTRRGIEAVVSPTATRLYEYAAFGASGVTLDSNSRTDSYDSSLGAYASQAVNGHGSGRHGGENGDIGSNGDVTGASNIKVWGDVTAGGTVHVPHGSVSGHIEQNAPPKTLPPIVVPATVSALAASARNVGGNSSVTVAAGDHHWSSFVMDSNATITIRGPARIVVDGPARASSNTRVLIDSSNGPVDFYFRAAVQFDSNTEIRSLNRRPEDVKLQITTDNRSGGPPVEIDSNAEVYALVYAPNASLRLDSNGQLYGAVIADRIRLSSNYRIHYDEDAAHEGEPGRYHALSWRQFIP